MDCVRVRLAWLGWSLVVGSILVLAGCDDKITSPTPHDPPHISVRYLLVGFAGSVPGQPVTRSRAQAESLALSLHERATTGGEDFGNLVQTYSDSPSRDTIDIANYGVVPAPGEYARVSLVRGFGDVAFAIAPDSVGLAVYDSVTCPFGWFLIHRID